MEVIKLQNIVKQFGNYKAVDGVSFSVKKGRIFGLLGPNGAGKTTTIRMINNILIPDSGHIYILDELINQRSRNIIGYLPEERGLYKKLKVLEQILYFAKLKNMSEKDATSKCKYWLEKLGATGWENKKIQELSKGMQQKVQFIATIIHEPEILILDEPFSGLDPINTELLKNVIKELKSQDKTIILSTHVMEQVEQLCDDICLINKGKVILDGKVREIKKRYGKDSYLIEYEGETDVFHSIENIRILNESKHRIEFRLNNNNIQTNDILLQILKKVDVHKFIISEPSLNEIFIESVANSQKQEVQSAI